MKSLARRLLQTENCSDATEVSILLTDDKQIAELNRTYREIEGPTDVLSFSQIEGEDEFADEAEESLLGDIVISVETAQRQAQERGHSLDDEMDTLLAHGLLHLLGYDHAEPDEADRMFALQNELLGKPGSDQ